MPSTLRSFVAVLVGYMAMMIVVVALTLIFVKTMSLKSGHPTPAYLVINTVYSLLAALVGGFVTARLAVRKPVRHGAILAGVIFVMGVISYRHYAGSQPLWYQGMMQILPPLCAVAGAALCARNATSSPE